MSYSARIFIAPGTLSPHGRLGLVAALFLVGARSPVGPAVRAFRAFLTITESGALGRRTRMSLAGGAPCETRWRFSDVSLTPIRDPCRPCGHWRTGNEAARGLDAPQDEARSAVCGRWGRGRRRGGWVRVHLFRAVPDLCSQAVLADLALSCGSGLLEHAIRWSLDDRQRLGRATACARSWDSSRPRMTRWDGRLRSPARRRLPRSVTW